MFFAPFPVDIKIAVRFAFVIGLDYPSLGERQVNFRVFLNGALGSILFGLIGCQPVSGYVFQKTGVVLDVQATTATLRELHLPNLIQPEASLLVKGKVVATGQGETYLVIEERESKVLVEVSAVDQDEVREMAGKKLEVYGNFRGGRKGLPLIVAIAIRELI
jgi:hypothetical protein